MGWRDLSTTEIDMSFVAASHSLEGGDSRDTDIRAVIPVHKT